MFSSGIFILGTNRFPGLPFNRDVFRKYKEITWNKSANWKIQGEIWNLLSYFHPFPKEPIMSLTHLFLYKDNFPNKTLKFATCPGFGCILFMNTFLSDNEYSSFYRCTQIVNFVFVKFTCINKSYFLIWSFKFILRFICTEGRESNVTFWCFLRKFNVLFISRSKKFVAFTCACFGSV